MKKSEKKSDDIATLRDCTQGDIVVIGWPGGSDATLRETEQIVRVTSTPRGKKSTTIMVRLIDPETMCEYPDGVPELGGVFFNAHAIDVDTSVVCVVERSHRARVEEERGKTFDDADPMQRRDL